MRIAEAGWRILRELHPIMLDRLCRRALEEIEPIIGDHSRSHHQRYLEVYGLIERRNQELVDAFQDTRRSVALIRIAHLRRLGLLDESEFARFGEETCKEVSAMVGIAGT